MSKLVYKTKREAFQKLARTLDTFAKASSPVEVNKISLAVVLLKIYTRFLKTNFDQIKEYEYLRKSQIKNIQMKRTALKNLAKSIGGKVSEYYREFINTLKVDQKLYASNKYSQSIQMNYKATILVHKLQALSKIKRTEAMNASFSALKHHLLRSPLLSARIDSRKVLSIEVDDTSERKSPIINKDAVLNSDFKSPNFKYLQERAAGGHSATKENWDQNDVYIEKVANIHEETNQSFGDFLRESGENPLLRGSRGYKINFELDEDFKEQLGSVNIKKFDFEEPEEEKRMNSGTKTNFSIIENAGGYDTNSDHFNWTQSAREEIHSQNYSPRVKGINLLRNYGLQFNNPLDDVDSQRKDHLMMKQNPKYIKEKAQLHNPNESLEILKTGREDSRFTEEYAEPLELEAKAQAPLLQSDPELHLSSINSSNLLGTGHSLSIGTSNFTSIITPKNVPGIFSPSSSQSNGKDYVYTKILPKPGNLKNPTIRIDKPHEKPQTGGVKKTVTIHAGSLPPKNQKWKNNDLFLVEALETNALRSKSNDKNITKNKIPTKKSTPTGSQKSGSSTVSPTEAALKSARSVKLSKENKPLELDVVSPRYDYFGSEAVITSQGPLQVIENRPKKLNSRQSSQESLKPPKSSSKKDLKIQIPYSPSAELMSPSGNPIGGGVMDKLEQRLLDGEKYGTLYELYKERNPEKAENIKSLMKGNVSTKGAATSRNYSPNGTFVSPKYA